MRAQRVREAESRIEMQIAKWTAEDTVKGFCYTEQNLFTERMGVYP